MQNRFGLLVTDEMPIYMIMPRYSHNYAQFCQLLNSNSFTHCRILMLLRDATSETYGPRVYLYHINTKNIILSYLSDLTLVRGRVGIGNPLSRWLRGFICFVQVRGTHA